MVAHPGIFIRYWNWKSAAISSVLRAQVFFAANIRAGWKAAMGAMAAEFLLQSMVAGFYGSLQQAFSAVEPAWHGALAAALAVPILQPLLELGVHSALGTPKLRTSVIASFCFTVLATLFNWYSMRRNALTVGPGSQSIWSDLRRIPSLFLGLLPGASCFIWNSRESHDIDNVTVDPGTGATDRA